MIDQTLRAGRWLALPFLCLSLAGCGSSSSSGQPSTMQSIGNVLMFQSTKPPVPDQLPKDEEEEVVCPQVIIADGGAALRAQSGPDSSSLRHQISILNVARECTPTGNGGGFRLKVGVEGRVLLGPAGGPGSYSATLTTSVTRGTTVIARRAARVGGTIAAGQGGADFSHVEDGITVPPGKGDIEIIVGLGQGGADAPARRRR